MLNRRILFLAKNKIKRIKWFWGIRKNKQETGEIQEIYEKHELNSDATLDRDSKDISKF